MIGIIINVKTIHKNFLSFLLLFTPKSSSTLGNDFRNNATIGKAITLKIIGNNTNVNLTITSILASDIILYVIVSKERDKIKKIKT